MQQIARRSNDNDIQIGVRLKARRKELGLSLTEVANRLDISYQQIQKYENGTNGIRAGRLFDIAAILEVPVQYFYDGICRLQSPICRHCSASL